MDFLFHIVHRIVLRADRAALRRRVKQLNRGGHRFSEDAVYGKRLEIHAAPGSCITVEAGAEINNDSWLIAHADNRLTIGERVFISQHCTVSGNVSIGQNTLIAGFVTIIDANHNFNRSDVPIAEQGGSNAPIVIGEDVWIGASSVVLPGVTIGDHAVIGANSTVNADVPAWAVAVGTPARVVSTREH